MCFKLSCHKCTDLRAELWMLYALAMANNTRGTIYVTRTCTREKANTLLEGVCAVPIADR